MNDELANDRTFLAWLRMGIACFGLGFVVAKVALIIDAGADAVHQTYRWPRTTTVVAVAAGLLLALLITIST
jgi:uncharacterized membrane protein YidH (DUF202 family)